MLTLDKPTVIVKFDNRINSTDFIAKIMEMVFDLAKRDPYYGANGSKEIATSLFMLAEFVRQCEKSGLPECRIVEDSQIKPLRYASNNYFPYRWSVSKNAEEGIYSVEPNFMKYLIRGND
jgi:hypothetical protein